MNVYLAGYAQTVTDNNKGNLGLKPKFFQCMEFLAYADDFMLNQRFSPDAVIGQANGKALALFPKDKIAWTLTIYNYITLGLLKTKDLDLLQKVMRKPKNKHSRVHNKILGQSIDVRPAEINKRKTTAYVSKAIAKLRIEYGWTFEEVFKSITADNDSELAELALSLYYSHPFSSWG